MRFHPRTSVWSSMAQSNNVSIEWWVLVPDMDGESTLGIILLWLIRNHLDANIFYVSEKPKSMG